MKYSINFLFALTLVALLSACSKDDPENTSLEGTWTVESVTVTSNSSTTLQGQTSEVDLQMVGSNLAYDLIFDGTNFTTAGSYDFTIDYTVTGSTPTTQTESYSNVSGSGTYTTDGKSITTMGSFFTLEYNGTPVLGGSEPQTAAYEINSAGKLVFSQDETSKTNSGGIDIESTTTSRSVWVRK